MDVYWLEQTEAEVPTENDWLSANEVICLSRMRFAKRRADWRLGRWTAKRALAVGLSLPDHPPAFADLEIRPEPSGAPVAFVGNEPADLTVSLSHRASTALCAIARSGVELGCDLEIVEPRSEAFVADYFTAEEQALVAQASAADRLGVLALLWSAKESALKALRQGLRFDTRSMTVRPVGRFGLNRWSLLLVRYAGGRVFHGWWQFEDGKVRTLVATPPPDAPIPLEIPRVFPAAAASSGT